MKYAIRYAFVPVLLFFTGCHLAGNSQPNNPFAAVQTAPPPATFSAQGAYLGQTPSVLTPPASYVPQTPVSTFTPSTAPAAVPAAETSSPFSPVDSSQPYSIPASAGYGSLNPNQGALLFQNSGQNGASAVNQNSALNSNTSGGTDNSVPQITGWTAALPAEQSIPKSLPIAAGYANQTAAQGMENITGQIIHSTGSNTAGMSYVDPNTIIANSSQITATVIEDDRKKTPPTPAAVQPQVMYANQSGL